MYRREGGGEDIQCSAQNSNIIFLTYHDKKLNIMFAWKNKSVSFAEDNKAELQNFLDPVLAKP